MYAQGEIGPALLADAPAQRELEVRGACTHGFTAIFGLFVVPRRARRGAGALLAYANDAEVASAYAEYRRALEELAPPPPPPSAADASGDVGGSFTIPSSLAELRALPIRSLKRAMVNLGIGAPPGTEKEEIVRAVATELGL